MPRPALGLVKVNFFLDPNVLKGFKWLATARGTTYSELLRLAAKEYIVEEIHKEQRDIEILATTQEAADG